MHGGDKRCLHGQIEIVRIIKSNGSEEYRRRCACGAQGFGVKHSDIPDATSVRTVEDNRMSVPPCCVCGARGAELHHWAPRAKFDDCEVWPTAWLCPRCHARWHNVMRSA